MSNVTSERDPLILEVRESTDTQKVVCDLIEQLQVYHDWLFEDRLAKLVEDHRLRELLAALPPMTEPEEE